MYTISGHHHMSMIVKNAQKTNYFYETILGLRRVKVTVNQDDPTMYHLFYGDYVGNPGTALTFFEMPMVGRTYKGTNAITKIGLVVPSETSLTYWKKRFDEFSIANERLDNNITKREELHIRDPDGLQLVFVVGSNASSNKFIAWNQSPVPEKHQIQGIGHVGIAVRRLQKFRRTLTEIFNYAVVKESEKNIVFQSIQGNIFGEIVAKELDGPTEKPGRGSIHHIAIRAKNEEQLQYWKKRIHERGFPATDIIDRFYFKSLYFRESNGIVIEIATDGPGFDIDRDIDSLGKHLDLPPFLEEKRLEIEKSLNPLFE